MSALVVAQAARAAAPAKPELVVQVVAPHRDDVMGGPVSLACSARVYGFTRRWSVQTEKEALRKSFEARLVSHDEILHCKRVVGAAGGARGEVHHVASQER